MSLDWLLGPQLQAIADAGYEVIGVSAPGPHVEHIEALGIRHVAAPALTRGTNLLQDVRAAYQVRRVLRTLRPDILHTHNPKPGVIGRVVGRLARVPLVVNTQHGLYAQPSDRRRRRWPVYAAERIAAAFSHVELVQSPEDVDTLVDVLRVPRGKVTLLGNGIDLQRFAPAAVPAGARERLRASWGLGIDEFVCGSVSRLVREKGIIELLDAAHALRRTGSTVRFVHIGPTDADKADAISASLIDRARADGVVFAGQRSDMPECYASMDMFVTASWREGFPRAAMEAAAMGLPTVATNIRGNRQVVVDGVTGTLVPVGDHHALGKAVAATANGAPFDGQRTVARAHELFDQQRIVEITLDAYRLLGRS